jgi:tetratricopeptide (TPR) repeat protein
MASVVVALAATFAAAPAVAVDAREMKGREEFAAGRYQEALDIFAKLYAETLHPIYLRNVGRCYQNLGDPDRAITSFREYLRKHKTIGPHERSEVEGFIAEMEELKKQRAAAVATPAPPPPSAASTITPLVVAPQPSTGAAPEALVTIPSEPSSEPSSPVYTRWWFWTIVATVAVGAGLGVAAATGAFTRTTDARCPTASGYVCEP